MCWRICSAREDGNTTVAVFLVDKLVRRTSGRWTGRSASASGGPKSLDYGDE